MSAVKFFFILIVASGSEQLTSKANIVASGSEQLTSKANIVANACEQLEDTTGMSPWSFIHILINKRTKLGFLANSGIVTDIVTKCDGFYPKHYSAI